MRLLRWDGLAGWLLTLLATRAATDARPAIAIPVSLRGAVGRVLPSSQRQRRLNSLEDLAARLGGIGKQVEEFLLERENERGDSTSTSFVGVQTSIRQASILVKALSQEGSKLLDASSVLDHKTYSIYQAFLPLQPAFVSRHGLVALAACPDRMKILLGVVKDLFQLSQNVVLLSTTAAKASQVLDSLHGTLNSELSTIDVRHRESSGMVDLTRLLSNLHFDALHTSLINRASEAFLTGKTLAEVVVQLQPLSGALSGGRSLAGRLLEFHKDQVLYTKAMTCLPREWQSLEREAIGVCEGTHKVIQEVRSFHCRLIGFLAHETIPGIVELRSLTESCDEQAECSKAEDVLGVGACPQIVFSNGIRNAMQGSSFFMGVVLLRAEQWVMHSASTRVLCALVLFAAPGIAVGMCGYRYKDVEFWIHGFLGGFLTFSAIISTWICWSGACCEYCHTSGALCDWRFLLVTIAILSLVWASAVVRGEKCQLFFGGFNLGAILGGVLCLTLEYQKISDGVLDPELAKKEIVLLLTTSTMSGVILGGLTLCWTRPAITTGTSTFGAALITVAILMLRNLTGWVHDAGWVELAIFLLLFVINVVTQLKCTVPPADLEEKAGQTQVSSSTRTRSSSPLPLALNSSPLPRALSVPPLPSTYGRRET